MADIERDWKFQYFVINQLMSITKLLTNVGQDISVQGNVCCPFHDDINPSARVYTGENSPDKIYCYSEHKSFYCSHVLQLLYPKTPIEVWFTRIWTKQVDEKKRQLVTLFNERSEGDFMPKGWKDYKRDQVKSFRLEEQTSDQLLESLFIFIRDHLV